MDVKAYNDDELLTHLKGSDKERSRALNWICSQNVWYKSTLKVTLQMGGGEHDAEDVFQEGLSAFTYNVIKGKFEGQSKALTYFIGICKNIYLKKYRNSKNTVELSSEMIQDVDGGRESSWIYDDDQNEKVQTMRHLMDKMKDACRQILKLYAVGLPMEDIAMEMGFENKQSAKNKTKSCRDKLRNLIVEDENMYSKVKQWL